MRRIGLSAKQIFDWFSLCIVAHIGVYKSSPSALIFMLKCCRGCFYHAMSGCPAFWLHEIQLKKPLRIGQFERKFWSIHSSKKWRSFRECFWRKITTINVNKLVYFNNNLYWWYNVFWRINTFSFRFSNFSRWILEDSKIRREWFRNFWCVWRITLCRQVHSSLPKRTSLYQDKSSKNRLLGRASIMKVCLLGQK